MRAVDAEAHTTTRAGRRHEVLRGVQRHDASAVDHRDPVAQALRLLHEVRREQHRRAAFTNPPHQLPDLAPRLRVEAGRELVEQHDLGLVDERQRDERALLLPARQLPKRYAGALREAEAREQMRPRAPFRIEGREEIERLPDLQPVRQRRVLQLHADPRS